MDKNYHVCYTSNLVLPEAIDWRCAENSSEKVC